MNRTVLTYWTVIFLLQVLFIAWYKGMLTPDRVFPPDSLVMTATEAKLTKQAVGLVRNAVSTNEITSSENALDALSAELPKSVRERVMKALGYPDIGFMREALDILEGKIEVKR